MDLAPKQARRRAVGEAIEAGRLHDGNVPLPWTTRQQGNIKLADQLRQQAENGERRSARTGPRPWSRRSATGGRRRRERDASRQARERKSAKHPVDWALMRSGLTDLVCQQVDQGVRRASRSRMSDVDAWLDDGPHPSITRQIALTRCFSASGLIPEPESAQGEGSGGSSDA